MAPHGLDWFRARKFGQGPYAGSASAGDAVTLFQWQTMDQVLRSERPVDLMTVSGGQLVYMPAPRGWDDVHPASSGRAGSGAGDRQRAGR